MTTTEKPPGVAVVLKHPDGTDVFLVGVAHVSPTSPQDAISAIETVSPGAVLLELDQDRYEKLLNMAASGDKYGIARFNKGSVTQVLPAVLTGHIIEYIFGLTYVIFGAVCGAPAGHEMVAADSAAKEVGAEVVLGDRDQSLTLKRLMAATATNRWGRKPATGTLPSTEAPPSVKSGEPVDTQAAEPAVGLETGDDSKPEKATDPWGLGEEPDRTTVQSIGRRWKPFLEAGGCTNSEAAIAAFKRILQAGVERKPIDLNDLASARACARPVVEHARRQALEKGDDMMRELENRALAEAKGASGLEPSIKAMEDTMGRERDLILARRLWETAEKTGGRPVVGVVGAAHVKGITQAWPTIGSWEAKTKVQEFMKVPAGYDRGGQVVSTTLTAGLVGYLAYKRPRAALLVVGAGTVVMTPYIIFTTHILNRWRGFANEMVTAAEQLDEMGPLQP